MVKVTPSDHFCGTGTQVRLHKQQRDIAARLIRGCVPLRCWAKPCCFWLGRPLQTLYFLVLKLVVWKKEALLVTHSINLWLVLQAFSLRSFNQGVICAGWSGSLSTRQISHFATRKFGLNTEPHEGFTLELLLRLRWMQMPLPSLYPLINKRYFHICWELIPLGTTSPQADIYKPLWFDALTPRSLSIIAQPYSIDHYCFIRKRSPGISVRNSFHYFGPHRLI